jgi:hypothetical protein
MSLNENLQFKKYIVDQSVRLIKFSLTLGLLCFLTIRFPNEASQIISTVGAYILGGSKLGEKLGI